MSSLSQKIPVISEKRILFLKSDSFQKLKCSARYPFQLPGLKLNRDSLKRLLETLIVKARIFSQRVFMAQVVAILQIGSVLSLWVNVSAGNASTSRLQSCDPYNDTKKSLSSFERRLIYMKSLKKQHQLNKIQDDGNNKSSLLLQDELEVSAAQANPEIETTILKTEADRRITDTTTVVSSRCSTEKLLSHSTQIRRKANRSPLLSCFVYGCAIFVYVQLLCLGLLLNTAQLPPGLLFMITNLFLIAFIAAKIVFWKDCNRAKVKTIEKSLEKKEKISIDKTVNKRQSRTRVRNFAIAMARDSFIKFKLL